MGRAARRVAAVAAAFLLGGCTSSGTPSGPSRPEGGAPTTSAPAPTGRSSPAPIAPIPTAPISTAPTTAATAAACPLLDEQSAAGRVGMRLARITVLTSGGTTVGCRLYALQNSPLHRSEHLPGPNQPAIEINLIRYASAAAAHNAFVLISRRGRNPQQATVKVDNAGVCYQTDFYPRDNGTDWACAFSVGTTAVIVKTVVVSPALNVVLVTKEIATHL